MENSLCGCPAHQASERKSLNQPRLYIFLLMHLHRVYMFYTHFMLDGVGYSKKSALVRRHTYTHFPNSRNKRGNFAPSLTPGSKREADQQQLRANLKATSIIRSPGSKAPEPINRSPPQPINIADSRNYSYL